MKIFHAQVDTSGSSGFAQPVVRIIVVMGKDLLPVFYQSGWNRLCTDMHQSPLVQMVLFQVDIPVFNGNQNILGPWHQQPYDGDLFLRHGFKYPLGLDTFQNYRPGANDQIPKPVHFGTCVIKGGNTKKIVRVGLVVVTVFHHARGFKVSVGQKDRLWGAGGA